MEWNQSNFFKVKAFQSHLQVIIWVTTFVNIFNHQVTISTQENDVKFCCCFYGSCFTKIRIFKLLTIIIWMEVRKATHIECMCNWPIKTHSRCIDKQTNYSFKDVQKTLDNKLIKHVMLWIFAKGENAIFRRIWMELRYILSPSQLFHQLFQLRKFLSILYRPHFSFMSLCANCFPRLRSKERKGWWQRCLKIFQNFDRRFLQKF